MLSHRIFIFNPYLDCYINEFEQKFINHKVTLNNFQWLYYLNKENEDKFIKLANDYKDDLEFN